MSPGRKPSRSPASTAGRDRMMRSTSLRSSSETAWATASQVLPVPAGPVPNTSSWRSQRADIGVLRGGARAHRALAQVDLLEARARRRRVEVEQRALRDGQADRAVDVAGGEVVAALELLVEAFEHAARLLAGVARALDGDVIAARVGDDAEPPLDQREILVVLAEQRRGEPVVVEGEHDLGRRRCLGAAGSSPWSGPSVRNGVRPPCRRELRLAPARCRGERAEQAVGADLDDRHRHDLADQRCRRHRPAPAADRASGRRAGRDGGPASRTARRSVVPDAARR